MSEVITFNTEVTDVSVKQQPKLKTFDLVELNSPVLHQVLPDFDFEKPPVDPNGFASSLVETCKQHNGLGLSANQCGFTHRVFVMGADEEYVAYFNPKLISSDGEAHMEEGCLSFPLLMLKMTRPRSVVVEYQDYTGTKHTKTFDGMTARCFLHELEHMNGIMYTQRVKPLALQFGLKKLEKIRRKFFNPARMKQLQKSVK